MGRDLQNLGFPTGMGRPASMKPVKGGGPYCRVCNSYRPWHEHGRLRLQVYRLQRHLGLRR